MMPMPIDLDTLVMPAHGNGPGVGRMRYWLVLDRAAEVSMPLV
jgi:hypothetical protein